MIEEIHNSDDVAVLHGDCLEYMLSLPDKCVDLVMCSPPYEDARTYGIDFKHKNDAWVLWAFERFMECHRICRGLTCWVVEGKTRDFQYSATPILLMAALHEAGVKLRKPLIYKRFGIPGGSPDYLKNNYEFVICASHGKLPWSDNTAMGGPPKCQPGGAMSNRKKNGDRVGTCNSTDRRAKGDLKPRRYIPPDRVNPGNCIGFDDASSVIDCGAAGGGNLGSQLAHENEAPYPESLCNHIIRSFCPPDGVVFDPFIGSGTTISAALKAGRNSIGIDVRKSMAELTVRRIAETRLKIAKEKESPPCSPNEPVSQEPTTPRP